jgi:hypothetical protein
VYPKEKERKREGPHFTRCKVASVRGRARERARERGSVELCEVVGEETNKTFDYGILFVGEGEDEEEDIKSIKYGRVRAHR